MTRKIRTAVIGVGYLGRFHAEKYAADGSAELVGVVDADRERARSVAEQLGTGHFTRVEDVLGIVDAVSIAVPTVHHYAVARQCLDSGLHVLLEKPVTAELRHADELIAAADGKRLILQVGHIERFNPALTAVRERMRSPRYIQAERSAPFTVRCTDVNVILDLMIHDLDIVCDLAGAAPAEISAGGVSVITKEIDLATARIVFRNGCIADVTASRISDEKKRVLRVVDGDVLYTADYQSQAAFVSKRGDAPVPEFLPAPLPTVRTDTLAAEIRSFLGCIRNGERPAVGGIEGRRALALAMQITRNIEQGTAAFTPAS